MLLLAGRIIVFKKTHIQSISRSTGYSILLMDGVVSLHEVLVLGRAAVQ